MNERIKELEKLATPRCYDETGCYIGNKFDVEKFAELMVKECTMLLFDESERLSGLYSEEANFRLAEEHEICSNQCINDITLLEKHFGVEE